MPWHSRTMWCLIRLRYINAVYLISVSSSWYIVYSVWNTMVQICVKPLVLLPNLVSCHNCLLSCLWLQCSKSSLFSLFSASGHPHLCPLSHHPTSVWGLDVDSELACCQAYYAGLCRCTGLERTREAKAGPLYHPHQDWLGSGRGSMHAHERLAWPGPYAFNTGTDVEHRPWAFTPLVPFLCPPHWLKPAMLSWAMLSWPLV